MKQWEPMGRGEEKKRKATTAHDQIKQNEN